MPVSPAIPSWAGIPVVRPSQRVETSVPRLPPRPTGLRDLLRARTADGHAALEATPLMRAFASGIGDSRYAHDYLSRQYRLHRACETALAPSIPADVAVVRLAKCDWLAEDLRQFDQVPAGPAVAVPAVDSWASALGMLYVIEGSTLGLQKVRRDVLATGSAGWLVASRFVRGYGDATATHWREFIRLLEALPARHWSDAVDAAMGTFAAFLDTFQETTHD